MPLGVCIGLPVARVDDPAAWAAAPAARQRACAGVAAALGCPAFAHRGIAPPFSFLDDAIAPNSFSA